VTLYEPAKSLQDRIDSLIEEYHGPLHRADVQVKAEWATLSGDDDKPSAVMKDGYPCLAVVKPTNYRQRVRGWPDAFITIDRRGWDRLSEEEQDARLDHELEHLRLVPAAGQDDVGETGAWRSDDLGRPVLKNRPHDFEIGLFYDVARRHGEHSAEVAAMQTLWEDNGQLLFPFADEFAGARMRESLA
jgi:hypothetical protein